MKSKKKTSLDLAIKMITKTKGKENLHLLLRELVDRIEELRKNHYEQYNVVGRSEQLPPFYCPNCGNEWDTNKNNACQCGAYVKR